MSTPDTKTPRQRLSEALQEPKADYRSPLGDASFQSGNRPHSRPLWLGNIGDRAAIFSLPDYHVDAIISGYHPDPTQARLSRQALLGRLIKDYHPWHEARELCRRMSEILAWEYDPFDPKRVNCGRLDIDSEMWRKTYRRHWRELRALRVQYDADAVAAFAWVIGQKDPDLASVATFG